MARGRQKTHNEFLEEFKQKSKHSSTIQILTDYVKNQSPILCRCLNCGYEWSTTPRSLLEGRNCPKCSGCALISHEEFLQKLKEKNTHFENIEFLSEYHGIGKHIECKCKICGEEWKPKANDLLQAGSGCPRCSGNIGYSHEHFIKSFHARNEYSKTIEILGTYHRSLEPIECKCLICGKVWTPLASSLIQGTGCPSCAQKRVAKRGREILASLPKELPISHADFCEKFKAKNHRSSSIIFLSEYKGANYKIHCLCKNCNNSWYANPSALLSNSGCPYCSHTSTSFMEQFVYFAFVHLMGNEMVLNRDKLLIGTELDIVVPSYKVAVEIGSWKWHSSIFQRDLLKHEKCLQIGFRLFTIFDSCPDEIMDSEHEFEDVFFVKENLGFVGNRAKLKMITCKILSAIGLSQELDHIDWPSIEEQASLHSQRITHEDYVIKLKNRNIHFAHGTLKLLSRYTKAIEPIRCKCSQCGKEWSTAACELLKGTGCPSCQIKAVGQRRSKQSQILEWRKNNPYGTKRECQKDTGISAMTVYKWWDAKPTTEATL